MISVLLGFSLFLLLSVIVGLGFILLRRGRVDALLAAILFGTTGVALTLVLGQALAVESAVDVALAFALLAAVLGTVAALRGWTAPEAGEDGK